jgi:hypothetical protein
MKNGERPGRKGNRKAGLKAYARFYCGSRSGASVPLSEEKRRSIEAITSRARLNRLADRVLTAKSLDEMEL